jgi:hypothetical protein
MAMELEILKILIDASKHVQSVYINNVWATMGSYLVALGWLLTSSEARNHFSSNKTLLRNSIIVTIGIFLIHILVLIEGHLESQYLMDEIQNLNKIPEKQLQNLAKLYSIPWFWPAISLTINGAIVALLVQKLFQLINHEKA